MVKQRGYTFKHVPQKGVFYEKGSKVYRDYRFVYGNCINNVNPVKQGRCQSPKETKMGKKIIVLGLAALMLTIGGAVFAQTVVTLDQAIGYGVNEIETRLTQGVRVMLLNFISPSPRLTDYVLDEMMTSLTRNGKIRVVEKADLEFILLELNYQRSGSISDETARSIGRILGAQYIISGSIEESNSNYVVQFKTMAVEPGALQTITRVGVIRDGQIVDLIAAASARTGAATPTRTGAGTPTQTETGTSARTRPEPSAQTEDDTPAPMGADTSNKLVLSAGGGVLGKFDIAHVKNNKSFETDTSIIFATPLFFNADIFTYLSFNASAYYMLANSSGENLNFIGSTFSLFGQYPIQIASGITLSPLFGAGYEMFFYIWQGKNSFSRSDFSNNLDALFLKPGVGLNYTLTGNLRLNARFIYDFLLYASDVKIFSEYIRHGPGLFVGVDYVFLKM